VFDYKGWRKEYILDFFSETNFESELSVDEFGYKANRGKDETEYLFSRYLIDTLMPILEERTGINKYIVEGAEGDDLIALLCESIDDDIMVYTVDSDMLQLLKTKGKNVFIIYPKQRSKHKKLYVPTEITKKVQDSNVNDFFSLDNSNIVGSNYDYIVESLTSKDYVKYEIDPTDVTLTKVFRGDAKDNISRMTKMTPKKTEELISILKEEYGDSIMEEFINLSDDLVNFVVREIMKLHKLKEDDQASRNDIEKHFKLNVKLIILNSKLFPEELVQEFNDLYHGRDITRFNYKKLFELKNNPSLI
jgi:hypothetical protein